MDHGCSPPVEVSSSSTVAEAMEIEPKAAESNIFVSILNPNPV